MADTANTKNTLNLMGDAFLSADAGVELYPLPTEGIAVSLMSAKGSKIVDKNLMLAGDGKYYVAQLTTPKGEICWAMIPTTYTQLKWDNNICWALLKPIPTVMSASDFHALTNNK